MTKDHKTEIIISEPEQISLFVRQANHFIESKLYLGVHTIGSNPSGVISYPTGNVENSTLKPTVKPVSITPPFRISFSQNDEDTSVFHSNCEFSPDPSQDWMLDILKYHFARAVATSLPKPRSPTSINS
ncbi:hypothetical protein HYV64_00315 [Candidatus Shapirobacteria bacterium]|nr:hypothetical protein [Candidatus Shapirobacteria bacterium]